MVSIEEQLKYIYNIKENYLFSQKDYNKLNKNINSLYLISKLINIFKNMLPNTLIDLSYWTNIYINNLPLNLKFLVCYKSNCNLPPNIIYLSCNYYNIYNFPRSLQFIYFNVINIIPNNLIDHNYNIKNINFIDYYNFIIKLKSIY